MSCPEQEIGCWCAEEHYNDSCMNFELGKNDWGQSLDHVCDVFFVCVVSATPMSKQKLYEREGRNTSSNDPNMLNSRVFIGNLASDKVGRQEIENLFSRFGKVLGVSLHKSYGFVQFESENSAKDSVESVNGQKLHGQILGMTAGGSCGVH